MSEKRISDQIKKARLLHWQRMSCSEAVWLALNSDLEPELQRFGSKMAVGFAGGVASGSLCGAVAGAVLAISAKYGHYPEEVRSTIVRELEERLYKDVSETLGSAYCRDLKTEDETQRRVCNSIIGQVCEIAARIVAEQQENDVADC